jgi:hypothetical protein
VANNIPPEVESSRVKSPRARLKVTVKVSVRLLRHSKVRKMRKVMMILASQSI